MNAHRILILGDSFVAEGLACMLGRMPQLSMIDAVSTVEAALTVLAGQAVDALIVVGASEETITWYLAVLARYPNLPILRSDVGVTKIQLITSRCIEARLDQLLAAIALLPTSDSATPDLELVWRG